MKFTVERKTGQTTLLTRDDLAIVVHDKATALYDAGVEPERVNATIEGGPALREWLVEGTHTAEAEQQAHAVLKELDAIGRRFEQGG